MLKKLSLYFLLLFITQAISAQEELSKLTAKTVNWGFKIGFNALSSTHYNVWENDTEITDKSVTNKVGFVGGLFMRVNLSNFFMQPEAAYSFAPEQFDFTPPSKSGDTQAKLNFKAYYHSLNVPVLAGYNVVKNGPYLFNIFVGPDFRYNYLIQFDQNSNKFNDQSAKYYINGIIGFSMNISHLYFDFRYEICRPNTDIEFNKIDDAPDYLQDIKIKKNANILNFSCGLMF